MNVRWKPLFLAALLAGASAAHALPIELLTNPGLESPGGGGATTVPTGWTLLETSSAAPGTPDSAQLAAFAARTGTQGLWLRGFEGLFFPTSGSNSVVSAVLSQTVAGIGGEQYTFSAWSRWEGNYTGGVSTLAAGSPSGAIPSPTDTLLEMVFLDASMTMLGAVTLDLRAVQTNDNQWRQQVLTGTAPIGTASVRVSASALDMIPNIDPGQSAFFDDFSLTARSSSVPEPGTLALVAVAIAGLALGRRRRAGR